MNLRILFLLLTCAITARSMEQKPQPCTTYNGTVIDAQSIYGLSDKLPGESLSIVNQWAQGNKDMLHALVPEYEKLNLTGPTIRPEIQNSKELLKKYNYKDLGNWSYIFKLPAQLGDEYYVQIAGPILKRRNVITYNGLGWHNMNDITESSQRSHTFQGVSRVATYLRCKEKINELAKKGKVYFKVPETYLVQIPGRLNIEKAAYDDNSFVLQKSFGDAVPFREGKIVNEKGDEVGVIVSKKIEEITPKAIEHAVAVILYAGLWDGKPNLMWDGSSFVMSDLEQGMDENPAKFYNKKFKKYWCNARQGIESLAILLQAGLNQGYDVKDACRKVRELIETNEDVQKSPQAALFNEQTIFKYE